MTIDQLVYFLAAAEYGSINAAAQQFFVTQQALNASLRKLEEELDCELLNRGYKGITLTPQGQIFRGYADNIVHEYHQAVMALGSYNAQNKQIKGTLSLFTASIFTDLFLPDIIRDFTAIYPYTSIKIIEIDNENLLYYLADNYCDCALLSVNGPYLTRYLQSLHDDTLQMRTLLVDRLVICVRKDHPLSIQREVNAEILTAFFEKNPVKFSLYQVVPMTMRDELYRLSVSNSSNAELHKKLILEDIAITYMPALAYQYKFDNDTFVAISLSDAETVDHCLLYRDDPQADNHQLVNAFAQFLHNYFAHIFGAHLETYPNRHALLHHAAMFKI